MSKKILAVGVSLLLSGVALGASHRTHVHSRIGVRQKPSARAAGPAGFGGTTNVSTVSSVGFVPIDSGVGYSSDVDTFFRYDLAIPADNTAPLILPAGAVIDQIGLGSCDQAGANLGVAVYFQPADGSTYVTVEDFVSSAHGPTTPCAMDYSPSTLGYQLLTNAATSLQLDVYEQDGAPVDGSVNFGSVEVWWHTVVSPAPATPTFGDVPTTDFGYQYIEALAASGITGGCGGGNYCPDNPVNRRQMAIFLAKALGLYWPD